MGTNPIDIFSLLEELDHRDTLKFQEGKKKCYSQQHPVFKEKDSTAKTRIAFGGGAKPSNGTQHK